VRVAKPLKGKKSGEKMGILGKPPLYLRTVLRYNIVDNREGGTNDA